MTKMHSEMSAKCRPFHSGLIVLNDITAPDLRSVRRITRLNWPRDPTHWVTFVDKDKRKSENRNAGLFYLYAATQVLSDES